MVLFCSCDAGQRSQGAYRLPLFADNLSDIVRRDTHFDEGGSITLLDLANVHLFAIVDQRLNDHLDGVSHNSKLRPALQLLLVQHACWL